MELNIHRLIHPTIQKLAYEIIYQKSHTQLKNTDNEKTLGMLIFYETLRKWLRIDNIYIKKVDILKESYLLNHLDKYLIMTNIIKYYNIITDVQKILPESYLQHIDFDDINNIFNYNEKLQEYKIIIFEKFLKNYAIIDMINYLQKNNEINLNHVKIICITCNNNILKHIAQKYPQLNIYTIKII
uniref:Uracil phosphoribosyltransferase n=1 Tax=Gracilaria hainanensis TaxID=2871843 RepID=A0AAU7YPL2_9FLOR